MSNIEQGRTTEANIIEFLGLCKYGTSNHVARLCYQGRTQAQRLAKRKLQSMHERHLLSRTQIQHSYIYYTVASRPGKYLPHWLAVADVYAATVANKPNWCHIEQVETEAQGFASIRPDMYLLISTPTGKRAMFVEVDLAHLPVPQFDKVTKYSDVYEWGEWQGTRFDPFPSIAIVTTTEKRRVLLEKLCLTAPVSIKVLTMDYALRKGVW